MVNYNPLYTQYLMDRYGVSWFKLDESVASSIVDSKGNNTSTVTGTTIVSGVSGNARSFNGASFIQFNSRVIPLGKKSIRFKFKRNGNPLSDEYIVSNELGSSGNHGDRISVTASTGLMTWVSCRGTTGSFRLAFSSPSSVCDNQWHDILLTWDGTTNSNTAKMYVDNMVTPVAIATATATETTIQSANLVVGASSLTNARLFFNGQLDELEIYNEVVDPIMSKILLSSGDKHYSNTPTDKNLIPQMTSNTSPSGIARGSSKLSTNYWEYYAFDGAIDRSTAYFYSWISTTTTGWLEYEFPIKTIVNKYSLINGVNYASIAPKTWELQGSNDGVNYVTLDKRENVTDWILWEKKYFTFKNSTPYKIYRINITANNGHAQYVGLQEMEMFNVIPKLRVITGTVDEKMIVDHGSDELDFALYDGQEDIVKTPSTLGSGKTYEHTIDMSKRRVDKITLG